MKDILTKPKVKLMYSYTNQFKEHFAIVRDWRILWATNKQVFGGFIKIGVHRD